MAGVSVSKGKVGGGERVRSYSISLVDWGGGRSSLVGKLERTRTDFEGEIEVAANDVGNRKRDLGRDLTKKPSRKLQLASNCLDVGEP